MEVEAINAKDKSSATILNISKYHSTNATAEVLNSIVFLQQKKGYIVKLLTLVLAGYISLLKGFNNCICEHIYLTKPQ